LEGNNFQNGCSVTIGGLPATSITFIDENTLEMNTPAHSAGPADIIVTNPDNQSGIGYGLFYYGTPTPTPTISITFTNTRTFTITPTPANSGTTSPTITPSQTQSQTGTITPSPTQSQTKTITITFTESPTFTISPTLSSTPTITQTSTITPTFSNSPTITQTSTSTITATITLTFTITQTATVTPTFILKEVVEENSYCWPQPANRELNIVYGLNTSANISINIYNAAGNFVGNINDSSAISNFNTVKIDVSRFSPGIYYYIIKAKTNDGKEIKFKVNKFIVER